MDDRCWNCGSGAPEQCMDCTKLDEDAIKRLEAETERLRRERDEARGKGKALADRVVKFINRRVPDDGPDWEMTKLLRDVDAALEGEGDD